MGFYATHVLPHVVHFACGTKPAMQQRAKVVPGACGRVLEVGIGSGLNLQFYDARRVSKVWGVDPSPEMMQMAERVSRTVPFEVELIESRGEEIPLESGSVDTAVVTYALCTIRDAVGALREMRRVLRSRGQLIFCEHGAAPDTFVRRQQGLLNPLWKRVGGGCNLNRPIPSLIEAAGFRIERMDSMYIPGWRPASFNYWGCAIPARTRHGD